MEIRIARPPHLAHAAAAKQAGDFVSAEAAARSKRHVSVSGGRLYRASEVNGKKGRILIPYGPVEGPFGGDDSCTPRSRRRNWAASVVRARGRQDSRRHAPPA